MSSSAYSQPDEASSVDPSSRITEVESVCMSCLEKGVTKFLPICIPYFREVILVSFECPHCENRNNELMSVATIGDHGVRFELSASEPKDLSRQLVASEHCYVGIPEIELEFNPVGRTNGYLTTVEGQLVRFREGLESISATPGLLTSDQQQSLQALLSRLQDLISGNVPFRLVIDDPSGNSYLERFDLNTDHSVRESRYRRTPEQQVDLGLQPHAPEQSAPEEHGAEGEKKETDDEVDSSLCVFVDSCPGCGQQCETRMHPVNIPHFREVIIMATVCDRCGYKNNEVKSGGAIPPLGRKLTLKLESADDLNRDILKSDSCQVTIPEIDLELGTGTLGGRFTTIEGLLALIKDEMVDRVPFAFGDSADPDRKKRLDSLVSSLQSIIDGACPCTIILDDPLGGSYIQSLFAPDPDPQLSESFYERTFEQNEEFGLNDIRVENYAEDRD